jgi:alpha-mannosidase
MRAILASALFGLLVVLGTGRVGAETFAGRLQRLQAGQTVSVDDWRFHRPDSDQGEASELDDSNWQRVRVGYEWSGENTRVWFRARIVVPNTVGGFATKGGTLRLRLGVDDDGEIYVDGTLRQRFHWDDGDITLADAVTPGQTFVVAVRGINTLGNGQLRFCRLTYSLPGRLQTDFDLLTQEAEFLERLASHVSAADRIRIETALRTSEARFDAQALHLGGVQAAAMLVDARGPLLALVSLTRQYAVTYVGHAHIDMNWLWTWPETIDVCHRTWDSAMKLMDQFPDFGFVQSQPGAYVPIQTQYPDEFARMQRASARGQWDVVGGLWDESDTNMPSGEALVRSLFLGQRYFKQQFGRYAETGWLPDSFGHSWQMPQLMQGVGIRNFYHERCGDGIRFSWWQSPDGSRLLKANTDAYNASIEPDQMLEPWDNEPQYGLRQSLVVFGVGDHGGGPTREQILKGKNYQADPLLPEVRFSTADAFFDRLRADPHTGGLPVVDRDLQYFDMGCYTTHADLKKAVRTSENALYTGEVFAALAAMQGRPYPVNGFTQAWKPTAFAQFHDIMCGSAIHSTYTWMEALLDPARAYALHQAADALDRLTEALDTRGAATGERTVVVWNSLSFARDDVVRVEIPNAESYNSVRDAAGHRQPVQAADTGTLVFIAHGVPAFGHATYFLSPQSCDAAPDLKALALADSYVLENSALRVEIDRHTGVMTELLHKESGQSILHPGIMGNVLQLFGDSGNAWDLRFTGDKTSLTTQGVAVALAANGPVYTTLRVRHAFNASTFTQDITLYSGLRRVDVPTQVAWHEHGVTLKVAFPLNMAHPTPRVGIPYGSIARPDNGQENPGQKWMDVTEETPGTVTAATPLNLQPLFNADSAHNFDGIDRSYAPQLMPNLGRHQFGMNGVPVEYHRSDVTAFDNVACADQVVAVPATAKGDTLYLVGASAPATQMGMLTFVGVDGSRTAIPLILNDWILADNPSNEAIATFAYQLRDGGHTRDNGTGPHLWLVAVPLPQNLRVTQVILPHNARMHLFAATIAVAPPSKPLYGLTVLNDSKYGSDTNGSVFRLSLLRSSNDPDPNPDEGDQVFTYALLPHAGDWRTAGAEQAGLALNIPLQAVLATAHEGKKGAMVSMNGMGVINIATENGADDLVAGALKHCEDGPGYILRFFETHGRDTVARITFPQTVQAEETDLLERPLAHQRLKVEGNVVQMPVGHDQIVTLHITGLPDAGSEHSDAAPKDRR